MVLAATVDRFAARAAGRRVSLAIADPSDRPDDRSRRSAADRLALDRILGNLVDNALAVVGPGGRIRLEARPVDDAAGVPGPAIAFAVVDDGPGFPPGGTERAFERFYRGDPARSRPGPASGSRSSASLPEPMAAPPSPRTSRRTGRGSSVILPISPGLATR